MIAKNVSHAIQRPVFTTGNVRNTTVKTTLTVNIGMTTRKFKDRLTEHRDYPKRDVTTEPSGKHFTKSGHNVAHMKGLVLEKVRSPDPYVLKSREHLLIQKFNSFRQGLNQEP